jgi:hypothetical protein
VASSLVPAPVRSTIRLFLKKRHARIYSPVRVLPFYLDPFFVGCRDATRVSSIKPFIESDASECAKCTRNLLRHAPPATQAKWPAWHRCRMWSWAQFLTFPEPAHILTAAWSTRPHSACRMFGGLYMRTAPQLCCSISRPRCSPWCRRPRHNYAVPSSAPVFIREFETG